MRRHPWVGMRKFFPEVSGHFANRGWAEESRLHHGLHLELPTLCPYGMNLTDEVVQSTSGESNGTGEEPCPPYEYPAYLDERFWLVSVFGTSVAVSASFIASVPILNPLAAIRC